jgi:putative two-component system response regulator
MERANDLLEEKVLERTRELEEARVEIVMRLAMAAEYRDDSTGQHTLRVGRNSALLAAALGLPNDQVELIRSAARLHDVGKIGITDLIMLKPGKLTFEEFERMKTHTTIGATITSVLMVKDTQVVWQVRTFHWLAELWQLPMFTMPCVAKDLINHHGA